jgi:hypothetical protein
MNQASIQSLKNAAKTNHYGGNVMVCHPMHVLGVNTESYTNTMS